MTDTYWFEDVTEKIGQHIIKSKIRPATDKEVAECRELYAQGMCPHTIVQDESDWMYDYRSCAVCGTGLGAV